MSKKRVPASDLTPAAVLERAKSMANQWMWAVSLQHARITSPRPQDKGFHPFGVHGFNEADVHFLTIALRRLRAAAATIEHAPQHWPTVRPAIQSFDDSLPWLKRLRDVFEHLEDYAVDSNDRHSPTSRRELQVWSGGETGMHWLGYEINWKEALDVAQGLYGAVKTAYESLVSQQHRRDGQPQDGGAG